MGDASPLKTVEHKLHPWSSFLVMPLFGFANAGLHLSGVSISQLFHGVAGGIAVGLFIGKQIGVFGATYLAVKLGLGEKPAGASWTGIYGVGLLAGIGFTMSLFIGTLAWDDGSHAAEIRLGVLVGSLLSAARRHRRAELGAEEGGEVARHAEHLSTSRHSRETTDWRRSRQPCARRWPSMASANSTAPGARCYQFEARGRNARAGALRAGPGVFVQAMT